MAAAWYKLNMRLALRPCNSERAITIRIGGEVRYTKSKKSKRRLGNPQRPGGECDRQRIQMAVTGRCAHLGVPGDASIKELLNFRVVGYPEATPGTRPVEDRWLKPTSSHSFETGSLSSKCRR